MSRTGIVRRAQIGSRSWLGERSNEHAQPVKIASNGAGADGRPPAPAPHAEGPAGRPEALDEVQALLGDRPRQRDLLIEHLHLIQDNYGHLSAAHLAALAAEMKLAHTEVYEVATFYAHFDVVKEGETPPPPVTVRVCDSLSCAMAGAERLLNDLPGKLGADVRVVRAPCMGACDRAPVCAVGHVQVFKADAGEDRGRREDARRMRMPCNPGTIFAAYRKRRRLRAARRLPRRQAHARRH